MDFALDPADNQILIATLDEAVNSPIDADCEYLTTLEEYVDNGVRCVVADCSAIKFLTTTGIGALMRVHKRMIERDGVLRLVKLTDLVADELSTLRLDRMFEIYADIDSARAKELA